MSFKEKLKTEILPKTVDYYNSGLDINESIVKAAEDYKLNLDQTDRLVETMNTARVIAHYEKNASDRTASCDIADKNTVHKMLFTDKSTEKVASNELADPIWGDYSCYMSAENNYRKQKTLEKAASANTKLTEDVKEVNGKHGFTIEQVVEKVAYHTRILEDQRRFSENCTAMLQDHIATNLSKIAHSLSKGYEPERRYAIFKVACAEKYPQVMKSVESEVTDHIKSAAIPHLKKLARANIVDTSSIDTEYTLAKEVESDINEVPSLLNKVASIKKQEQYVKGLVRNYAGLNKTAQGAPFGPPTPPPSPKTSPDKNTNNKSKDSNKSSKSKNSKKDGINLAGFIESNFVSPGAKQVYDTLQGSFLTDSVIFDALRPSEDKTKSLKIKSQVENIQRSAIISDLYENDPILQEVDPDILISAYKSFAQAAPEASLNKEVTRAVLRQSTNSVAISPYDAKQWADLDHTILGNK